MANELRIALDITGKADVVAKIIDSVTGQVGIDIPLVEASTDAVYVGSVPALGVGIYTITYHDATGLLGAGELQWDGTKELDFTNIIVDVTVATSVVDGAVGLPTVLTDIDGTTKTNDGVLRVLHDERQEPILYLLANYLESQNKLISDITDVLFVIKENASDADGNALYSKFLSDPEITIDLSQSSIAVIVSDYNGLLVNGRYSLGIGIKYLGDIQWREVPVTHKLVEFRQDLIRA